MTRAIERAGCEDVHEVWEIWIDLVGYLESQMVCTELSQDIQNAILNNPKLKLHEAVIDKKNITIPGISEGKRPARSIIENV